MTTRSFLFVAAVAGALAGCGGGGDGGGGGVAPPAPPPPAACTAASFQATADATVALGKAAGATLASTCGPVTAVAWRQTAGPTVTLLSARTQAISFEPTDAGVYSFAVDFRDAAGVAHTATVSVNAVAPASPSAIVVRADQAVREGGKASVRAWPPVGTGETIAWTQVAGPAVTLDTDDPNRVLLTAPAVTQDTLIVLRATRTLAGGGTDADDVRILVENYEQAPPDPANSGPYAFSDMHVSRTYAYRANGPFADALVRCTYDAPLQYFGPTANACPLSVLPFLHQTTNGQVPTVSQIMDRVAVSHDWMGQVFEQFLTTQASDDLKRLFNGVTAIVIGAHVRPSFYYAATGAIYLDADNFWLNAEQRDVIDETPDFRSDFDRDLQYSTAWRYVENGQSIFVNFPATSRIGRDLGYLLAESGWLLYHELAHASDFLPPAQRSGLNLAQTAWGNISQLNWASTQLANTSPLQSQEMFGLAQVKFQGATATAEQRAYTPDQVAAFFTGDGRASDEYSYSRFGTTTPREDPAMLFEEFMMFRNHGWRRDFAFTDKITDATTGSTLTVRWGQRGRVGAATVKPRAELVVSLLAPWVLQANPNAVQSLPAPLQMRAGESWTSNLVLPAPPGGATIQALRTPLDAESARAMLLRDIGRHHTGSPNDRLVQRLSR